MLCCVVAGVVAPLALAVASQSPRAQLCESYALRLQSRGATRERALREAGEGVSSFTHKFRYTDFMIYIDRVTKHFGSFVAIDNVSLHIAPGDVYGIIGPSGAGKSTLVRCINRLEEPEDGEIRIGSANISAADAKELRKERRDIGMIFQSFHLMSRRTVYENVAMPLRMHKENDIDARVRKMLDLVGIADKADNYPSQLSGGQKQRVAIARALVGNPKILLCDEATSALDPLTSNQILLLIKGLAKQLGLTVLLITHSMEAVKLICNKVAIMQDGKLIKNGETLEVFSSPEMYFASELKTLPEGMKHGPLLSLVFTQESAMQPLIASLVREFGVEPNILWGNIEYIDEKPLGQLLLEFDKDRDRIDELVAYLRASNVEVEVLPCND